MLVPGKECYWMVVESQLFTQRTTMGSLVLVVCNLIDASVILPWEVKIYVLFFWQCFLLLSFLKLCNWFCLNSWDTTGASAKNISVAGRLHSGKFLGRSLIQQSPHESRRSLTSGGFFLQLIDKAPNPCNPIYPSEVKDTLLPIYISVADCHFQPE